MKAKLVTTALMAFIVISAFAGKKEDLAKEMFDLMDMKKNIESSLTQTQEIPLVMNIPEGEQKKMAESQKKLLAKIFEKLSASRSWEKMEQEYIKIYAEVYTEDELRAIVAFYKTPEGKSMLKKQSLVTLKTMEVDQKLMIAIAPEIQKITEECAKELTKEVKDSSKK